MAKAKQIIVGHRDIGILVFFQSNTKGIRNVIIPKSEIDAIAKTAGVLPDIVFGHIAKILSFASTATDARRPVDGDSTFEKESANLIALDTAHNVLGGAKVTNADFCFVTEVNEQDMEIGRLNTFTGILTSSLTTYMDSIEDKAKTATVSTVEIQSAKLDALSDWKASMIFK
jgi:hypothetical protein